MPPNFIPDTPFHLFGDGYPLGFSNLLHELNENLKARGGHIGYCIRPTERKKGYGYVILDLLVTCDESNIPYRKIIEKNGGRIDRVPTISATIG